MLIFLECRGPSRAELFGRDWDLGQSPHEQRHVAEGLSNAVGLNLNSRNLSEEERIK